MKKLFGYSKDRPLIVNIIILIVSIIGMLVIPALISLALMHHVSDMTASIIGDAVFILIMVLVFVRDLKDEAKRYFDDSD